MPKKTIERAIISAGIQDDCPILLLDDASTDNTVALAQEIESNRLTVRQLRQRTTLGAARQKALSDITTKYAVWLDADDAFYLERSACMLDALKRDGSDIAADCLDLYDGETNTLLKNVEALILLNRLTLYASWSAIIFLELAKWPFKLSILHIGV